MINISQYVLTKGSHLHFLEALKLRSKLFFILTIITLGLIMVGIMGAININSMKKNLDSLYFGSLLPVIELNGVIDAYHGRMYNTMYKARSGDISQSDAEFEIKSAIIRANEEWKSYEAHFKRYEEVEYVEYTASEIKITNEYLEKMLKEISDGHNIQDLSIDNFEKTVDHIHQVVDRLISYEIDIARYERKKFLQMYDSMMIKVGSMLAAITLGIIAISFYVFKGIQKDQTMLEVTTRKLKSANRRLENASYRDSLTGLYNRRYFNLVYERELRRARRDNSFVAFMMLDIDYFKQYNDTYGHVEGDNALKSIAKTLKDVLSRPSDFVFRLGGEEFGVLITETSEQESMSLAQAICDSVKMSEIKHNASEIGEFMTISVGVACCVADDALDKESLIAKADEMLYRAKESGRNRYEIAPDISETKVLLCARN